MEHRLYRDKAKAIAGGVAAGIGNFLKADPTIVRAIFVFLVIFGRTAVFSSFLVYCILWIAIPPLPLNTYSGGDFETDYRVDPVTGLPLATNRATTRSSTESSRIFGFILLALGLVFLADKFIDIDWNFDRYWPIVLILAGVALLVSNKNKNTSIVEADYKVKNDVQAGSNKVSHGSAESTYNTGNVLGTGHSSPGSNINGATETEHRD